MNVYLPWKSARFKVQAVGSTGEENSCLKSDLGYAYGNEVDKNLTLFFRVVC